MKTVEAYTEFGHKVTFKLDTNESDKETLAQQAESRLRNMGVPKSLCKIAKVK